MYSGPPIRPPLGQSRKRTIRGQPNSVATCPYFAFKMATEFRPAPDGTNNVDDDK